jgi:hypothetical protein
MLANSEYFLSSLMGRCGDINVVQQTNLTFQPTLFEESLLPSSPKVRVHSGTYEVSRRLYARLLPLIEQHLASHPEVRPCASP